MNNVFEQMQTSEGRAWLAMQYVLDELPLDRISAFEEAMLVDPSLCEAVVEASRLTSGILLACDQVPAALPASRYWRNRTTGVGVIAVSAAALLAAVTMLLVNSRYESDVIPGVDSETVDAFASLLPDDVAVDMAADSIDEDYTEDGVSDLVAPEWLLTAVDLDEETTNTPTQNEENVF